MSEIRLSQLLGPAFYPLAHDVFRHGHTHYDLSGGRGSLKSSCVSILVPLLLIRNPDAHALVLRKVANTIRDSVFAQYVWAIGRMGMAACWTAKTSPPELVYKKTGQKILFRGADDPMKLKSIKVPFGYIAVTHFEEKDQFAGRAEIRNILQSTMRGGPVYWNFESYNPPISRDNWANLDSLEEREDRLCHRSTYLEAPPEWLGEQFLAEAGQLRRTNPRAYEHEYLGVPVGRGGNVFENVVSRPISDAEIETLGNFYGGLDFGFAVDPTAFGVQAYDRAHRRLYILDEIYEPRLSLARLSEKIREKGWGRLSITADSAEPRSIDSLRGDHGLSVRGARKGPDSVAYGIRWLQSLSEIVIDRGRTPNAYREFTLYEYECDREGKFISAYPDKNNHFIDQCRYALEPVIGRRTARAAPIRLGG